MAQEIVKWCDRHFDKGERVVGATKVVALDYAPFELELCDDCWQELAGALAEVVGEHGRPSSTEKLTGPPLGRRTSKGKQQSVQCPVEGCTERMTRHSFRNHLADQHGTTLAVMEGQLGRTLEGDPIEVYCDVDGCEAGFVDARGLGAHKRTMHGATNEASTTPVAPEPAKQPARKVASKRASSKAKAGGSSK